MSFVVISALLTVGLAADVPPASAPASRPASQPAPPRMVCDQPTHKLKDVWSGQKVEHAFVIRNSGGSPLQITNIEAACGCFVANDYPRSLAPGAQGEIKVSLQTVMGSREVHKEMQVTTNDPARPKVMLVIEGPLTPRIEVDPMFGANWGRLYPGVSLTRTVKLTNHFNKPFKLELEDSGTHDDYTVEVKEVEPGQRAELIVTAKPNLKEGPHMGQIIFKTGFEEEPELIVPATLFVPPKLELTPIAFSVYSRADQEDKQTVMVRWNGPSVMKIAEVKADAEGVKAELTEREVGRMWHLVVTMPPGFQRPASGQVQVKLKTDQKEQPEIVVTVSPRVLPSQPAR